MGFHVPNEYRIRTGPFGSSDEIGNNGLFEWGTLNGRILVIASDCAGWEHVSISFQNRTPTWAEMCKVKDIFWDKEDCIIQFHPPESDYVSFAKHCLHLWRPVDQVIPRPPTWMVGPKGRADL